MPIYKDCTLGEMLFIGGIVLMAEIIFLSIVTRVLFGFFSIGVAIALASFFHITKFFLNKLQKVKYGKPYAYYKHFVVKTLSEKGWMQGKYITRIGKWSVRRMR